MSGSLLQYSILLTAHLRRMAGALTDRGPPTAPDEAMSGPRSRCARARVARADAVAYLAALHRSVAAAAWPAAVAGSYALQTFSLVTMTGVSR